MLKFTIFTIFSLMLISTVDIFASDKNATTVNKVEIIVRVAGIQETVDSIEKSSQQIVALTQKISNKEDFTKKDHKLIANLTQALNNNANAINNIALAIPKQFEKVEDGIDNIIDTTAISVKDVIKNSKDNLVNPILERIENRVLILILIVSAVLFGLLWYGLWKIGNIASVGSETITNIMSTVKSLESVLEKMNRSEKKI